MATTIKPVVGIGAGRMGSYYWAKVWIEVLDDAKMGRLSDRLWRRTIELILIAKDLDENGYLPSLEDMAWRLRTNAELLEAELTDMARVGIVENHANGWLVTNFTKRQGAMSSTERSALHRGRQKKQEYNKSETVQEHTGDGSATNRPIDIDKIRSDIDIETPTHSGIAYEHKPKDTPFANHAELRQDMVSAIAGVVKTTCAIGFNSDDFERIADALIERGAKPDDVPGFKAWWTSNGHYSGPPALKSLVGHWGEYSQPGEPAKEWWANEISK